jgi:hypothetical protein
MKRIAILIALLAPLLGGCDQLKERMGMHDPAKVEAEGKAVGAACRNAGQGLEDCYSLNPGTGKADIYAGWKEMNEYMTKNNMQVIAPASAMRSYASGSAAAEPAPTPAPPVTPPASSGATKAPVPAKAGDKPASPGH